MANAHPFHDWNLTPSAAVALQKELREQTILQPLDFSRLKTVAGADISFNRFSDTVFAGIVVLEFPSLKVLERSGAVVEVDFPYIPGLLSFREIPALLEAWKKLEVTPDLLVCDGHGIAHPRRLGIASHIGLLIQRPTIGCGKSVLVGKFDEPETTRGHWTSLIHHDQTIGAALRTKNNVKPVFASPGHLIDLASSIEVLLRCDGGYRLPEPTRKAHLFVNELRQKA